MRLLPSLAVVAVSEAPSPESVAKSDQQFLKNEQDTIEVGVLCDVRCGAKELWRMCAVWWCAVSCGVLCIAVLCAVRCVLGCDTFFIVNLSLSLLFKTTAHHTSRMLRVREPRHHARRVGSEEGSQNYEVTPRPCRKRKRTLPNTNRLFTQLCIVCFRQYVFRCFSYSEGCRKERYELPIDSTVRL